ncbi:MAG: SUMF1/EgtB/PvdO family nonheme iron enzyme, partial [bacterium]
MKTLKFIIYFSVILLAISVYFMPVVLRAGQESLISPKDYAEMVPVSAGDFFMGSPYNRGDADEQPQRKVYLDKFFIYKYEVTVKQYKIFCKETDYKMPPEPSWGWIDTHPIVNVSRYDAEAYCKWARVSLPTEAQWEKAARGTEGRVFPWGQKW